jgi:hypothetical protein
VLERFRLRTGEDTGVEGGRTGVDTGVGRRTGVDAGVGCVGARTGVDTGVGARTGGFTGVATGATGLLPERLTVLIRMFGELCLS